MRRRGYLPEPPFRQLGDPLYSQRNPHQTFLLALSVLSGIGLVEGLTGSPVLDEAMDDQAVIVWGWCLIIGSVTAGLGMWWWRTYTGLVIERAGLFVVGSAAGIYSWLVWDAAPEEAYTTYAHLAYSAACFWRVVQITRRLWWVRKQVARVNEGSDG